MLTTKLDERTQSPITLQPLAPVDPWGAGNIQGEGKLLREGQHPWGRTLSAMEGVPHPTSYPKILTCSQNGEH